MIRYAYQYEGRGRGYTVWTIGYSGTRIDCIGYARSSRDAQALVNRKRTPVERARLI